MIRRVPIILAIGSLLGCALSAPPSHAAIRTFPPQWRVAPPPATSGNGLIVRFANPASVTTIAIATAATETVAVNVSTMPNVNFPINQGCTFGIWNHGCSHFAVRYTGFLNFKVPGRYRLAFSVDDGGELRIANEVIVQLDGLNWNGTVVSDTLEVLEAGLYPMRQIFYDGPPCCRGIRLGGLGPAGSGLLPLNNTYNFTADLGPCCITGGGGPGASVIPQSLFYTSLGTVDVEPVASPEHSGELLAHRASPNPFRFSTLVEFVLESESRVWVDVLDVTGRRVASLAEGTRFPAGTSRLVWNAGLRSERSGLYFYRVRLEDGSGAVGRIARVD